MQVERLASAHASAMLPPTSRAKRGIRTYAIAIGNEITKGLIDLWRGKIASFLELILFGLFFLAIAFALGRGAFLSTAPSFHRMKANNCNRCSRRV